MTQQGTSVLDSPRALLREVAHDLLQPTTTITALVDAALAQAGTPALVRQCLEDIAHEARYATDSCLLLLTDDHREAVRIDRLVEVTVASARTTYPGELCLAVEPSQMTGDAVALRRAIANLLDNASRAAGIAGRVDLHVTRGDAETIVVEVHDSGPGFGAGPNGRAHLGLAIVQRIVADHDGRMVVRASPLGGACIRLEFPAATDLTELVCGDRRELDPL